MLNGGLSSQLGEGQRWTSASHSFVESSLNSLLTSSTFAVIESLCPVYRREFIIEPHQLISHVMFKRPLALGFFVTDPH